MEAPKKIINPVTLEQEHHLAFEDIRALAASIAGLGVVPSKLYAGRAVMAWLREQDNGPELLFGPFTWSSAILGVEVVYDPDFEPAYWCLVDAGHNRITHGTLD